MGRTLNTGPIRQNMAFKTINKLFKGELIQVTPCKGYGYIKPAWNKEELSSKNLYCYYASSTEKQRKKCFLKIFEKGGKYSPHEVKHTYKGEEIWIPSNPQIIFFEVEVEGPNYRCVHLYDERHLPSKEKALAETNSQTEPDFKALLKEQEEPTKEKALAETNSAEEPGKKALAEEKETSVNEVSTEDEEKAVTVEDSAPVAETGESYDAYQDGQDCGERDYKDSRENLLGKYDLGDLSWQEQQEFERGYENGYRSAEFEVIEELANNIQVCSYKEEQKARSPKLKEEETTSSKASEKEASKNRKAQKKAEEEAFKASFN